MKGTGVAPGVSIGKKLILCYALLLKNRPLNVANIGGPHRCIEPAPGFDENLVHGRKKKGWDMEEKNGNRPETKENGTGIRRLVKAGFCSWAGFRGAWQRESAFRQELLCAAALVPLGLWLGKTGMERALLMGSLLVLLIVELFNSAIEAVVDRIGPERHELSGFAKDLGSAAVFLALLHVTVVWVLVLLF